MECFTGLQAFLTHRVRARVFAPCTPLTGALLPLPSCRSQIANPLKHGALCLDAGGSGLFFTRYQRKEMQQPFLAADKRRQKYFSFKNWILQEFLLVRFSLFSWNTRKLQCCFVKSLVILLSLCKKNNSENTAAHVALLPSFFFFFFFLPRLNPVGRNQHFLWKRRLVRAVVVLVRSLEFLLASPASFRSFSCGVKSRDCWDWSEDSATRTHAVRPSETLPLTSPVTNKRWCVFCVKAKSAVWEQKWKADGAWRCLSTEMTFVLFTEATRSNIPRCTRVRSLSRGLSDIKPSEFRLLHCSFVRPDRRRVKVLSLELLWVYAAHVVLQRGRPALLSASLGHRWQRDWVLSVALARSTWRETSQSSTPNSREGSHSRINESCEVCRRLARSSETWTTSRREVALEVFWLWL